MSKNSYFWYSNYVLAEFDIKKSYTHVDSAHIGVHRFRLEWKLKVNFMDDQTAFDCFDHKCCISIHLKFYGIFYVRLLWEESKRANQDEHESWTEYYQICNFIALILNEHISPHSNWIPWLFPSAIRIVYLCFWCSPGEINFASAKKWKF